MSINQVSTSNTFAQWLVATQQLIDKYNYVEDTANSIAVIITNSENTMNSIAQTAYSNVNSVYSNTVNVYSNTASVYSNTVIVYGNTLNVYSNTVNVYNSTANVYSNTVNAQNETSNVYSNTVNVYNSIQSYVSTAYNTANAISNIALSSANTANLALITANAALIAANTIFANVFNITDETASVDTFYPTLAKVTVGVPDDVYVSSTKLYFNPLTGQLNSTNFNSLSDENKKTDIRTIKNSLVLLNYLRGVRFAWKDSGIESIGVIAQEVELILPEVVDTNENGEKSVSYGNIIGLLIEAIKEQQTQINELRSKLL